MTEPSTENISQIRVNLWNPKKGSDIHLISRIATREAIPDRPTSSNIIIQLLAKSPLFLLVSFIQLDFLFQRYPLIYEIV